jgi:hypothetical protein
MPSPSTQEFTSAAYIYTDLTANVTCATSDPRAATGGSVGAGRYCRAFLVTSAGTLDSIRADGTTVDIADSIPAGTLVPIQAKVLLASSGAKGLVLY